jgi:excisionase family DNA binding protein
MRDVELLTTAQVLDLLQIGRTKLWELVRSGAFPAYRVGTGRSAPLRYRRDEVLRWLEGNRVNGAPDPREARP